VGQYRLSAGFALGTFVVQALLMKMPKAVFCIPAGLCLALLIVLHWCVRSHSERWIILGGAVAVGGLLAVLIVLSMGHLVCALLHPVLGIRREGERVFVQYDLRLSRLAARFVPPGATMPQITGELLPDSESRFFGRTTGIPMTFSRDGRGRMTRATMRFLGAAFSHQRISDQPPEACAPRKPRLPVKLDTRLLDACVGDFEFAPSKAYPAGIRATIRRQGDQLLWQARGKNAFPGAFNIYPESETHFFFKMSGARLTFIKNGDGEVTAVSLQDGTWLPIPDSEGRKLKAE